MLVSMKGFFVRIIPSTAILFKTFYPKKLPFVGKSYLFIKNSLLKKLPCIAKYLVAYYLCPMKDNRPEVSGHEKVKAVVNLKSII